MHGVLYFNPTPLMVVVVVKASVIFLMLESVHMNETPKPLDPLVHTAKRSVAAIFIVIFVCFLGFNALILLLLGGVFAATSYGSLSYDGTAEARVNSVNVTPPEEDGMVYCTFNYSFDVGAKNYSGISSTGTPDSCALQPGTTVPIKYDKQAPTNNTTAGKTEFYVGAAMLGVGVVLVLVILTTLVLARMASKRSDRNNDGLFNDDMPATTAQLNVIDSGMRDLGEFWVPRSMTQLEARDVIRDIETKLASRSSTPPSPQS